MSTEAEEADAFLRGRLAAMNPFARAAWRSKFGYVAEHPVAPAPAPTPAQVQLQAQIAENDAREAAELATIADPINQAAYRQAHNLYRK